MGTSRSGNDETRTQGNFAEAARPRVLVLQRQELARAAMRGALGDIGCEVVDVGEARAAVELAARQRFAVAVVEHDPPRLRADEIVTALRSKLPWIAVVVTTWSPMIAAPNIAGARRVDGGSLDELEVAVRDALAPSV